MKSLRIITLLAGLMLAFAFSASAQVTVTNPGNTMPGLSAAYPSLAAAITDLNLQTDIGGPVIITLDAGNPQTAPAGGYAITAVLAGASAVNTVTITGSGNTITAPTPQASGALNDAIFKFIGSDFMILDNFVMTENAANTTTAAGTNNMTEWGVALLYASTTNGAQNITIQNNTIDLDRTYQNTFGIYSNSTHSATTVTTSATATTAAGGNDNLKIFNNNITDVNMGIVHIGPTAAADQNNTLDIGGTTALTGNMITNWGTTATFSGYANVSGTVNGILVRNTRNFNISRNTVNSSNGGVTAGTLNGIQIPAASNAPTGTLTQTINNNSISLRSAVLAGATVGITMPGTSVNATTTNSINNNDFNTFGHTVAGATGTITFISQGGNPLVQNLNGNTFTNLSVNTTGTITFFSFAPSLIATASMSLSSNSIVTGFTRTGVGTTTIYSSNASSVAGSTKNISSNNFSNFTLTGASAFNGILDTDGGAPVKTINTNTISNITTGAGTVVPMSVNFSGPGSNVNNNTITGITTGNSITALLIGASNAATITVSGNTIDPITSGGTSVIGISVAGVGAVVSKNKIYDLSGTAAGSVVAGIANIGTTTNSTITLSNNIIGNLTAPIATGSNAVIGINITGSALTSNFHVFYNTVYLNNTTSGAGFGSSGISTLASATATTSTLNMKNNIFVNTSVQNGAGLTVAYRRSLGTAGTLANYASASNNNDFFAGTPGPLNLIYSDGTSTAQTLLNYKNGVFTAGTIAPRDSASISENPPFLSTTGSSPQFLHINPAVPTQLESGGMPVAGITDDFDGDTRNVSTPDIGADEGMFTLLDLIPPSITYTPLDKTISTANRVLTATITDPSGIAGGGLSPRIYFKKSTDGMYASTQCTGASPTYMCTIDNTLVGGGSVMLGDIVQYFVVAQDVPGNVGANPSAGFMATNVNNVTAPPTTPNQYTIVAAISGSFTVGTAETYTSLTNPGGIFEYINNNEVAGAIIINITSDLAGETGTHGLNAFAGAHTILIRPSGGPRSVTGSAASTALIRLNGASRVTIDGSFTGGTDRSLTIENTSVTTPQVVRFQSIGTTPVVNNTLKNSIIRNGVNTSSAVVLTDVTGVAGYFNNITIQNNDVQKAFVGIFTNSVVLAGNGSGLLITQNKLDTSGANAIRNVGAYVQGADGATVSNNTIGNFSTVEGENDTGIWLATGAVNSTVSNNTVSNFGQTTTGAFAPYGIRDSGGTAASGNNIIGNTITNMSSNGTTAVYGIENSSGGTTIQKNNVSGVINTSTVTYGAYGINIAAGNNSVVRNNFVSNVNHDMTGGAAFSTTFGVFGIRIAAGTGHQIYNNSVNLYGLQPGVPNSNLLTAAFAVVSTTSTGMDVRNNIFANNIIGGSTSVAHVSIYLPSGGTAAMNLTDNKNAYFYGTDAARAGTGQAGTTAGTNFYTTLPLLSAYTNTLGFATNDNMSQAYTTATVPSPFTSNTDLHFGDIASPLIGAGDVIGSVTNDFDMDPRPASNPDIGADELVQSTASSFPTGIFYNGVLAGNDVLVGNATITNSLTLTGISNTGPNTLTLGCDAAVSGAGMLNYIIGDVAKQFCAPGSFSFPVGTPEDAMLSALPEYSPFNANVTAVGSVPSTLTVSVTDGVLPGSSPTQSASRYWDVTETGDITADISFTYLDQDVSGLENVYQVLRREMGLTNVYLGGTVNELTNTANAPGVTEFSQWAAGNLAPTAANATVGGRVLTSDGRGISSARVVMIAPSGTPRMARTNPFGYYRFSDVPVGGQYVFSASDKRYQFVQPTITRSISGDDGGINFIALGGAGSGDRPNRTYFDNAPMDFDGDGLTDISFFREVDNSWTIQRSSDNTYTSQPFGLKTDRLAPADFDGDGRTDLAVFRPVEGNWYIWQSASNSLRIEKFGSAADIPFPSDFDGDGRADTALWRPGKNVLVVQQSSNGKTFEMGPFEGRGLVPRVGDYDGDGRAELAIFIADAGVWQIRFQNGKMLEAPVEGADGIPLFADFDGDGRADTGIYEVDTGVWTIRQSRSGEVIQIQQGGGTDTPLIGDFDGDGRMDAGVFREGTWLIRRSVTEAVHSREFGLPNDLALPSVYVSKQ